MMGHILIDKGRCKGCARCIVACPKGLIELSADLNEKGYRYVVFNGTEEDCTGCTLCARRCPQSVISGERQQAHTIDTEKCIRCGVCRDVCRFDAVVVH